MQIVSLYYVLFVFVCFRAIYMCTFALERFARKNRRVIEPQPMEACAVNTARSESKTFCMRRRGTADCHNQVPIHQYVISCIIRIHPSINQSIVVVLSGAPCSQMSPLASPTHTSKFQIRG